MLFATIILQNPVLTLHKSYVLTAEALLLFSKLCSQIVGIVSSCDLVDY